MKLRIDPRLHQQFPTLKVGVLWLEQITNHSNADISYQLLCRLTDSLKRTLKNAENDKWSEAFAKAGIPSEITPSHLTLLNRLLSSTSSLPNISNAVNVINRIQLIHGVPIGIHDADKTEGSVTIGENSKELNFLPRESQGAEGVSPSEIVYADEKNVITRNWAYKQGRKTLLTAESKNAFIVVDTLDMSDSKVEEILEELANNFNAFVHPTKISKGIMNSKYNEINTDDLSEIKKFKRVSIKGCKTISRNPEIIDRIVEKAVEEVLPSRENLKSLLNSGRRLRVYQGFDPTAPTLHIGHTVMMRKLEDFRKLGHEVFMLIGDFTGRIGDPTDKGAARRKLTEKEVLENLKLYKEQASSLLNMNDKDNPVTVVFNNDWLGQLRFAEIVDLASEFTVQQMIKRDMFQKRLENDKPIHLHEFLYPLMQGFDSVALNVDIELGGSDQLFNMLAGRTLIEKLYKKDKFVVSGKLLTTNEGAKMGKSEGNMIMLSDSPENIFGKVMAFSDEQILGGFELLTNSSIDKVNEVERKLKQGKNPMDLKKELAEIVVSELKGNKAAARAKEYFEGVFQKMSVNVELEIVKVSKSEMNILDLMVETGLSKSKSEARRLVEQDSVEVNQGKIVNWKSQINTKDIVLKVGKRTLRIL